MEVLKLQLINSKFSFVQFFLVQEKFSIFLGTKTKILFLSRVKKMKDHHHQQVCFYGKIGKILTKKLIKKVFGSPDSTDVENNPVFTVHE